MTPRLRRCQYTSRPTPGTDFLSMAHSWLLAPSKETLTCGFMTRWTSDHISSGTEMLYMSRCYDSFMPLNSRHHSRDRLWVASGLYQVIRQALSRMQSGVATLGRL